MSSGNIDKSRTRELITFLDDSKKWLIYEYCKLIDNRITIINEEEQEKLLNQ